MSSSHQKLESLFEVAISLGDPGERARYLDRECRDPRMRQEIESLLAAHEKPDRALTPKTFRVESSAEQVGTAIGRYKLLEALGEGGFGTVWLAEQKEPVRRKVALKIIKLGMDTKVVVARFEAERQALALMDHPNIAKVLDAGTTDSGRPYFVMELVRGISITRFCDENKLTVPERLDLFIKVCQAVQHAHQKGIIHRDLKPSNVLVTLHDGVPVPKVIDFGIAKATQQELTDKTIHTQFHQFVGTPAYVSPEQAEMSGLDIDTRSDIYSLGVLLYELLTGTTPFDASELLASGLEEMRRTIREKEPLRPSSRLSTMGMAAAISLAGHHREKLPALISLVRGDLDWIVMKCMEKDRARRYETASGLAADLRRHLNHEPVTARPPSASYRLQKAVRRNKLAFAAIAAVAGVLILGVIVSTWQAVRATNAERAQIRLREEAQRAATLEATARQTAVAARTLAETNERKAREEAARSAQAAKFIQSILTGIDVAAAQGEDRAVLFDILLRAGRRAELELTNQPQVQVEVITAISQGMDRLGMPDYAYEISRRAMSLGEAAFGPESPRTAELMTIVAPRALRYGHKKSAETLATQALAILRRDPGTNHPSTLAAMRELGHVLVSTGRPAEAEHLLREHLALADRVLDKSDEGHLTGRIHLARALTDQQRDAEAGLLLRDAAAGYERLVGFSSRRATATATLLCESLARQRRLSEAEQTARDWVTRLRSVRMQHPEAVQLTHRLGTLLAEAGKDAEAGEVLHEAFDLARGLPSGLRQSLGMDIVQSLATWLRRHGQEETAADLGRRLNQPVAALSATDPAAFLTGMLHLEAKLRADDSDAIAALGLAARQAWLGRIDDWRVTARRIVERLEHTTHPASIDRAAKSAAIVPGMDRATLEKARALARRILEQSGESLLLPYFQFCAGLTEFRLGNFAEAEVVLSAIKPDRKIRRMEAAFFYRAMIAHRQGRTEDARRLLEKGMRDMPPFPADDSAPLAPGQDHDELISWLACREAQAMIGTQP